MALTREWKIHKATVSLCFNESKSKKKLIGKAHWKKFQRRLKFSKSCKTNSFERISVAKKKKIEYKKIQTSDNKIAIANTLNGFLQNIIKTLSIPKFYQGDSVFDKIGDHRL